MSNFREFLNTNLLHFMVSDPGKQFTENFSIMIVFMLLLDKRNMYYRLLRTVMEELEDIFENHWDEIIAKISEYGIDDLEKSLEPEYSLPRLRANLKRCNQAILGDGDPADRPVLPFEEEEDDDLPFEP